MYVFLVYAELLFRAFPLINAFLLSIDFLLIYPKYLDRLTYANSAYPDQAANVAAWSGFALFAMTLWWLGGWVFSVPNIGSRGPELESCRRQNSAHDCMGLDCTEPLFITLSGSLYDLNDIERDVKHQTIIITFKDKYLFVLRFYGPVNPRGSCRARSVYLTWRLLGRLSPLSG